MEVKKSPKADLEGKKLTWMLIGYVLILATMFIAFEWTERDKNVNTDIGISEIVFEEELVPITEQQEKLVPPPPAAILDPPIINIVENDNPEGETPIVMPEDPKAPIVIKPVSTSTITNPEPPDEKIIFQVVEDMPEYPGGMRECMKYLASNLKYPTISAENGTQGKVIVQFVVNKDGTITDLVIVRGVDPYLDKEALRVVKSMPKWKPGMQRGKAVSVKYTLPVTFALQ